MKKRIFIIFIVCVVLITTTSMVLLYHPYFVARYVNEQYEGWQTVSIENVGTIKLPGEWVFTQEGNAIYITDAPLDMEYNLLIVGSVLYKSGKNNISAYSLVGAEYIGKTNFIDKNLPNHASYTKTMMKINDKEEERFTVILAAASPADIGSFIVYDASIDEELVIKILKSFVIASYTGETPYRP